MMLLQVEDQRIMSYNVQVLLAKDCRRVAWLAMKLDTPYGQVYSWLTGKAGVSPESHKKIAKVLKVSPAALIRGDVPNGAEKIVNRNQLFQVSLTDMIRASGDPDSSKKLYTHVRRWKNQEKIDFQGWLNIVNQR